MQRQVPCTQNTEAGISNPFLRNVLADANRRAGADLSIVLLALYMHEGELLATWESEEGRRAGASALSEAWHASAGDKRILNLIPTEYDYDYQEEVMDNAFDD